MGKFVAVVLPCALFLSGCADPSGSGDDATGEDITVFEIDLGQALGPQRATAWTVELRDTLFYEVAWAPDPGGIGYFHAVGSLTRYGAPQQPPIWQAPPTAIAVDDFVPGNDGGALIIDFSVDEANRTSSSFAAIASDGALRWEHTLVDRTVADRAKLVGLASGRTAVSFTPFTTDGSLETKGPVIAILDVNGAEISRTPLPNIFLPEFDELGDNNGPFSPGTGVVHPLALTPTADGGVLVTGRYYFGRAIECGTQDEPTDPVSLSCGDSSYVGMLARLDGNGTLVWASRFGVPYTFGNLSLTSVAVLADDTIITTGTRVTSRTGNVQQGAAIRWSANGGVMWAKSVPWGPAPGSRNIGLGVIAPQADGSFETVIVPESMSEEPFRIVRFEANGTVSRVQILENFGGTQVTGVRYVHAQAAGADLAFLQSKWNGSVYLGRLAPAP